MFFNYAAKIIRFFVRDDFLRVAEFNDYCLISDSWNGMC